MSWRSRMCIHEAGHLGIYYLATGWFCPIRLAWNCDPSVSGVDIGHIGNAEWEALCNVGGYAAEELFGYWWCRNKSHVDWTRVLEAGFHDPGAMCDWARKILEPYKENIQAVAEALKGTTYLSEAEVGAAWMRAGREGQKSGATEAPASNLVADASDLSGNDVLFFGAVVIGVGLVVAWAAGQ